MSSQVTVDSSSFDAMLKSLSSRDRLKAERATVRVAAGILKRKNDQLYTSKTRLKRNYVEYYTKGLTGRRRVREAAVLTKISQPKKDSFAKVHIMDNFKAKWFEMGTDGRYVKRAKIFSKRKKTVRRLGGDRRYGWRGKMFSGVGMRLFEQARKITRDRIFGEMKNRMHKAITRLAKKNGSS